MKNYYDATNILALPDGGAVLTLREETVGEDYWDISYGPFQLWRVDTEGNIPSVPISGTDGISSVSLAADGENLLVKLTTGVTKIISLNGTVISSYQLPGWSTSSDVSIALSIKINSYLVQIDMQDMHGFQCYTYLCV